MIKEKSSAPPQSLSPALVLQAVLATDLMAFIEYTFAVLRPGVRLERNWHLEAIAHQLTRIALGEVKRLIITVPPRNLKSICASVALPAWFLGHHPSERVVAVSYSKDLANQHANDFRRVVNDPLYQTIFPGMRVERDTDREIATTRRGRRYATSIDGTLTGLGGNLVIIDDPIKPGDAMSEAVRKRVIEWYRSTLVTRPDKKKEARIVVVMQRVHQDDLVGYLLDQGGFEVLNLPAVAQRDESFQLGRGGTHLRRAGEILNPAHEPGSVLLDIKSNMGPIAFSAQYQQSPLPAGGNIVKRKWLKTYNQPPATQPGDKIIISWDIALSETESGNYSAGVVLLRRREVFYILDVIRGRFRFDILKRKVQQVKETYGRACTLLIEDSPISKGLIQSLREQAISVTARRPDTDKQARLIAQCDLFEAGSVLLPERAPWVEEFVGELLAFPGRYDDQVDALTQGLAWGRESWSRRVRVGTTDIF
jgi:predicted phage terminase large subunit-like protein